MGGGSIAWADTSFYGEALELSGQLGLIFYLQNGNTQPSGTMTFTITPGNTTHMLQNPTETRTETIDGANVTLYGYMCPVTSIEMADTITATFTYDTDKTVTATKSVSSYLTDLAGNSKYTNYTNLQALVKAINAYGYYAQQTLNYSNNHTAMTHNPSPAIKTTDISGTTQVPAPNSPTLSTYAISVKDSSNNAVTGVSFALDLDSNTALHICLPSSIYPSGATASATVQKVTETTSGTITRSAYGNAVDATMTTDTETISGTEYTVLSISDIPAHEIDNKYTIEIKDSSNTKTHTIEISPLSYVYSVISKSDEQLNTDAELGDTGTYTKAQNLKKAVIAFYNYYAKTIAYRTSNEYSVQ